MTKELREQSLKQAKILAETTRNAVQNERKDALKDLKKALASSSSTTGVSKDQLMQREAKVQQAIDKALKKVDEMLELKVKELSC